MILRCKYTKVGDIAFISHLDLLKLFIRALRKSRIEVYYSAGFHPHPKLSFSSALSLGVESLTEFVDIDIKDEKDRDTFIERMNESLPEGIRILNMDVVEKPKALTTLMTHSLYEISVDGDLEKIQKVLDTVISSQELIFLKKNKKKRLVEMNIRTRIDSLEFNQTQGTIKALLLNSTDGALKPSELVKALNENYNLAMKPYKIIKTASFLFNGKEFEIV